MAKIVSLKLITGEEIVAEVNHRLEINDKVISYSVRRPHILSFQSVGPGQIGLAFVPWALSNPEIDNVHIPAEAVIAEFIPADKVERQYIEQTSGISIASAGSIKT